ncbi:glycoside hydrolase family 24 protein [Amanita thiersii Skay4041]|uniref:Glycoside hydrolase family 24 protein n=1 Tax=Amanita thiersii Skay4041 TaxID=703135 RepID=A0A2A9NKB1_9AGAR|nr:glycoside hydrolase family 24 protein [Amanita thiersii Skay4041]
MLSSLLITLFALSSTAVQGALNGTCSVNGTPGVCVKTAACSADGVPPTSNAAPRSGANPAAAANGATGVHPASSQKDSDSSDNTPSPRACPAPPANKASIDFIKGFEKFADSPYFDTGHKPTVGYGHLCTRDGCTELGIKFPMTVKQGEDLLQKDLGVSRGCITTDTTDRVRLNANQYGALVSWGFNVGCGNVKKSTLLARLNKGEDPNKVAASELPKFNRDSTGAVVAGLTRRRAGEVKLFQTPSNDGALPVMC